MVLNQASKRGAIRRCDKLQVCLRNVGCFSSSQVILRKVAIHFIPIIVSIVSVTVFWQLKQRQIENTPGEYDDDTEILLTGIVHANRFLIRIMKNSHFVCHDTWLMQGWLEQVEVTKNE